MYKKNNSGFTLIELLVVIAIIGILSSIVLVSLSSARAKSRDAQRVTSLKEMAKSISLADADPALPLTGCTGGLASNSSTLAAGGTNDASSCTGPSPIKFSGYKDPSTPGTVCTRTSSGTCQYAIFTSTGTAGAPTTQEYEICSYLEVGAGSLGVGRVRVTSTTSTAVVAGCQ